MEDSRPSEVALSEIPITAHRTAEIAPAESAHTHHITLSGESPDPNCIPFIIPNVPVEEIARLWIRFRAMTFTPLFEPA